MNPTIQLMLLNLRELLVSFDQVLNVVVCALTLQRGYSDETLSAHTWRARTKPLGRFFLPLIDFAFSWQPLDPAFRDAAGAVITSHCHRAFEKERTRRYSPPEEREDAQRNAA